VPMRSPVTTKQYASTSEQFVHVAPLSGLYCVLGVRTLPPTLPSACRTYLWEGHAQVPNLQPPVAAFWAGPRKLRLAARP